MHRKRSYVYGSLAVTTVFGLVGILALLYAPLNRVLGSLTLDLVHALNLSSLHVCLCALHLQPLVRVKWSCKFLVH